MSNFFLLLFLINLINSEDRLKIDIIQKVENCERLSKKNDLLFIHYRGTLENGFEFDSSYKKNEPFKFVIGIGQVIKGWDEGLLGMCVGEKRKLKIPPYLAYGDKGINGSIPPQSTLIFEVSLINIQDEQSFKNIFLEIDTNDDEQLSREEVSNYLKGKLLSTSDKNPYKDLNYDNLIEDIFQNEDSDKNGFISNKEFFDSKHDEL